MTDLDATLVHWRPAGRHRAAEHTRTRTVTWSWLLIAARDSAIAIASFGTLVMAIDVGMNLL